jgi:hypothetical protein
MIEFNGHKLIRKLNLDCGNLVFCKCDICGVILYRVNNTAKQFFASLINGDFGQELSGYGLDKLELDSCSTINMWKILK